MITIEGGAQLEAKLNALGRDAAKKIGRRAVTTAAGVIRTAARQNARSMVGGEMGSQIAKHIKSFVQKRQKRFYYSRGVDVDPKGQAEGIFVDIAEDGNRNYIPAAIEFGHDDAQPIPFLKSAWKANDRRSLSVMMKSLREGIESEARKQTRSKK